MLFIMIAIQIMNLFLKGHDARLKHLKKDLDNEIENMQNHTYMTKTMNHSQVSALIKKNIASKYI